MRPRPATPTLTLLAALLWMASCAGDPRAGRALPEDPPADFAVAVTVLSGAGGLTTARYILEPDGSLRAAYGPGATGRVFPPIVRRLDHDQRRRVWWITLDTRAHDPTAPWFVASPETVTPGAVPRVLVTTSFWGVRSSAAVPEGEEGFEPARTLGEELGRLAWVGP